MAFLGVIGGLGPMATAYFLELIVKMTDADCDQDHLKMIIYQAPDIPDRTRYILGKSSESPLPGFVKAGLSLKSQGVDLLAIPCITAHYFHDDLEHEIGVRTIHAIREFADLAAEKGISRVGLMATDGTVESGLFQKELNNKDIAVITPDSEHQKLVMSLIYDDIKKGKAPDMANFEAVRDHLRQNGAQVIILGCTELSLIKKDQDIGKGFTDMMEVLAAASIRASGKSVRKEYKDLVEKPV